MRTLLHDLRYGARMLLKNPGVSIVAVLTLALVSAPNTAIFSGVSAFVFRPLPVPKTEQLARPAEITEDRGFTDEFSYPDYKDYRTRNTVFSGNGRPKRWSRLRSAHKTRTMLSGASWSV